MESAVRGIENATTSIHRKKSMVMQKRASNLISSTFPIDDTALDVSHHAISNGQGLSVVSSTAISQQNLREVKALEAEMERVRGGVKLLGRSVERLNEAVTFDSRCCGVFFDSISYAVGSCFENIRPAVKNEYSSVLDTSEHLSANQDGLYDMRSDSSAL